MCVNIKYHKLDPSEMDIQKRQQPSPILPEMDGNGLYKLCITLQCWRFVIGFTTSQGHLGNPQNQRVAAHMKRSTTFGTEVQDGDISWYFYLYLSKDTKWLGMRHEMCAYLHYLLLPLS